MSDAQRRACEDGMAHWGIPYSDAPLDLAAAFGRTAPTILEIGFGMGRTTAEIAAAHPQNNYLGVEVHTPGVASLLREIRTRALTNIRIIRHDAVEVLTGMLADGTLAGIHIYFPDPWPKKRHHKRRLIQPAVAALMARKLAPGAYLHCATDWEDYAMQMLEVLSAEPQLKNTADGFAPRPQWRPLTKFEQRGIELGHGVWDLLFEKSLSAENCS
ncbi:MAG: tRNA (guanosine(46)-N7)-methyltransferase TrmB [Pseudomonadota bacterium]